MITTLFVFLIGLFGIFFNKKNLLMVLIIMELLLLSINLNFAIFSIYLDDALGHIFIIFILTIAAAESATGLSLIIRLYFITNKIDIYNVKQQLIKI